MKAFPSSARLPRQRASTPRAQLWYKFWTILRINDLSHEYILDGRTKAEASRLEFVRHHQKQLFPSEARPA